MVGGDVQTVEAETELSNHGVAEVLDVAVSAGATESGEIEWTVMGASRGEAGILGEGIRQALLRDPTYRPALDAANAMVS